MLTSIDIGNAKIEGLEDSLGMTDTDYNVRTFKNDTNQSMAHYFRQLTGRRGNLLCSIRSVSILAPKMKLFCDIVCSSTLRCEVPSNALLAKFSRPSYYMGTLVVCWGIIMTMVSFVEHFHF